MTLLAQTQYMAAFAVGVGVMYLQNGMAARYLLGAGANSVLSKVLKRVLNQERPETSLAQGKVDPGLPSSHAHMLSYLAASLFLDDFLLPPLLGVFPVKYCVALLAGIGSSWRVHIGRHTVLQVVVGIGTGSAGAFGWRKFWESVPKLETYFDATIEELRKSHPLLAFPLVLSAAVAGFVFLKVYSQRITGTTKASKSK